MKNWDNVVLVPEFDEQGVTCYRLEGGDYENLHRLDGLELELQCLRFRYPQRSLVGMRQQNGCLYYLQEDV